MLHGVRVEGWGTCFLGGQLGRGASGPCSNILLCSRHGLLGLRTALMLDQVIVMVSQVAPSKLEAAGGSTNPMPSPPMVEKGESCSEASTSPAELALSAEGRPDEAVEFLLAAVAPEIAKSKTISCRQERLRGLRRADTESTACQS